MHPTLAAFADALVLTGPTGSGKSAVALELAGRVGGEIVAMDSMTLYRGLDVGTAKPTAAERARVRHHLIDVLDPWESANVAWWLDRAAEACVDIRSRGKRPLIVGGTPFYLKALRCGLFDAPPADPDLRRRLEAEAEQVGPRALHDRLRAIDPTAADRLHPNDVRRVVRALEVWELTGRPISDFQQTWDTPTFAGRPPLSPSPLAGEGRGGGYKASAGDERRTVPAKLTPHPNPPPQGGREQEDSAGASPSHRFACVVLEWPRDELYRRIESRVDAMLAAGWLDEARRLREQPLGKESSQALGYRELREYLDGARGWAETIARIKTRTRQFAKRQLTWFRSLSGCLVCQADTTGTVDRVLNSWQNVQSNSSPVQS